MITNDPFVASQLYMRTPFTRPERKHPASRQDFGTGSEMLHLRRVPFDFAKSDNTKDFGIYGGEHGGNWIVFIKGIVSGLTGYGLTGYEEYASLDELKQHWELD